MGSSATFCWPVRVWPTKPSSSAFEAGRSRSGTPPTADSRHEVWFGPTAFSPTTERRCVDTPAEGRIQGKTGSMSGVRNVVGVATDARGRQLKLALLFNGVVSPQGPAIAIQDEVFVLLALSRRGRVRRRDWIAALGEDG